MTTGKTYILTHYTQIDVGLKIKKCKLHVVSDSHLDLEVKMRSNH
jgi:hypothetical protein